MLFAHLKILEFFSAFCQSQKCCLFFLFLLFFLQWDKESRQSKNILMLKRLQSNPPKNKNTNVMDKQNFYPAVKRNCIFQEAAEWPFPQTFFFLPTNISCTAPHNLKSSSYKYNLIFLSCTDSFVDFIGTLWEPLQSFNHSVFFFFFNNSTLWKLFFPKFEKIKAIKIYENIDILENYSNNKKNENNVA